MQQYEKVAFIVKNKGVKCEKKRGKHESMKKKMHAVKPR
jgi:hypothetical protein